MLMIETGQGTNTTIEPSRAEPSAASARRAVDAMDRAPNRPRERRSRLSPGYLPPSGFSSSSCSYGFFGRLARACIAACLLAAAFFLLPGAGAAQAQTATTLVSNLNQSIDSVGNFSTHDFGQSFQTGDYSDGYTLSSVDIRFGAEPDSGLRVRVVKGTNPSTGTAVATLANPSSLTSGINRFTAPAAVFAAAFFLLFAVGSRAARPFGSPRRLSLRWRCPASGAGLSTFPSTLQLNGDNTMETLRTIRNPIAALCRRRAGACLTLALAAAVAAWAPPALADVTEVEVSSAPVSGSTYRLGETIRFTVTFDEAVTVTGATTLAIDMDPAHWGTKYASYEAGSGTRTLTFAHTVTNPNFSTQGIAVLENSLRLNGVTMSHTGLGHDARHRVNWQLAPAAPSVTGVEVSSAPVSGSTYRLGETIRLTVTFDEAVTVTGAPTLAIDMDPAHWGTKQASYEAGSGTRTLTFAHTVTNPNFSTQGIAVLGNSLRLNGGGIASAASGANAALAYDGLGHNAGHKVDWRLEAAEVSAETEVLSIEKTDPPPLTTALATTPPPISVLAGRPASLPGGGYDLNLNTMANRFGPNVIVKVRTANKKQIHLSATGGGYGAGRYVVDIGDLWLTYPADAGDSDLAVHIKTTKAAFGNPGGILYRSAGTSKWNVVDAKADIENRGGDFADQDFFTTEAYLQAPGAAVQPTGTTRSATWSGKVIAFDSATDSILLRGIEIGGDAEVKVRFASSPTVDVTLDNLKATRGQSRHLVYGPQTWTGLSLSNGGFSDDSGGREIKGTFRNQGSTPGTNANTVGGVFDVKGMMKGGFVATFD